VVVALDQSALFQGNEIEVGLAGYRVLYKFGKSLKNVKDRKIVVTVPGEAKRGKGRNIAAARSASLGKFVKEDLNIEPHRVTASTRPPGPGAPQIEFSLETLPVANRS
jgi:hypothetical protein